MTLASHGSNLDHGYQECRTVGYAEREQEHEMLHFKKWETKGAGFFGTVDRNEKRLTGTQAPSQRENS